MNEECTRPASVLLASVCEVDEVVFSALANEPMSGVWYFSQSTGELIGVRAPLTPSMGCGKGNVYAGTTHREIFEQPCNPGRPIPPGCSTPCFAPSAECPADILAELPPAPPCGAPPPITHEICTADEAPAIGDDDFTCGASTCSSFGYGTCGGTCECHRRGRYEWNAWCTE